MHWGYTFGRKPPAPRREALKQAICCVKNKSTGRLRKRDFVVVVSDTARECAFGRNPPPPPREAL